MKRKGIAYTIIQLFTLMVAILGIGLTALTIQSDVSKIQPVIKEKEIEIDANILANFLLADQRLTYSSSTHRDIFNSTKLDETMFSKSSNPSISSCLDEKINSNKALCNQAAYPGSFILIMVKDTKNGNWWIAVLQPDSKETKTRIECIDKLSGRPSIDSLFALTDLVEGLQLKKCGFNRFSTLANQGFPVAIKYPDGQSHFGLLRVLIAQSVPEQVQK